MLLSARPRKQCTTGFDTIGYQQGVHGGWVLPSPMIISVWGGQVVCADTLGFDRTHSDQDRFDLRSVLCLLQVCGERENGRAVLIGAACS